MTLDGIALVTGGAERVGRVVAERLASDGATVAVNHFGREEAAEATVDAIRRAGGSAVAYEADVSSPDACRALVRQVVADHGRIDYLVHNASSFVSRPFLETTEQEFDTSFDVLVRGPYFLTQAAGAHMIEQGGGKVVAIAGNSCFEGWPMLTCHSIAKSALVRMMEVLSVTLAPTVQCHAVCPAHILNSENGTNTDLRARRGEISDGELLRLGEDVVLREGGPEDVGELISYLCGSTPYLNGTVISMDGGKRNF